MLGRGDSEDAGSDVPPDLKHRTPVPPHSSPRPSPPCHHPVDDADGSVGATPNSGARCPLARSQGLGSDVSLQSKRMVTLFATATSTYGAGYVVVREDLLFGGAVCPICAELGCRAASVDFSNKYGRKGGAKVDESAADRGAHRLTAQREARVAAQLRTPRCLLMDRRTGDDYVKTDFRTRVALGLLSATQAAKMTDCPTVKFKCNSHGVDTDPALSSDWLEVAKEKQLGVAMCSHNVVLHEHTNEREQQPNSGSPVQHTIRCVLSGLYASYRRRERCIGTY